MIDIADPTAPRGLGKATVLDGHVWDIAINDGHVFAAAGWAGLRAISFSDPLNPEQINVHMVGWAQNVAVVGHQADVVRVYGDMAVVDVGNPSRSRMTGQYPMRPAEMLGDSFPTSIALNGTLAFVVDSASYRVEIIDASDPRRPAAVGSISGLVRVGVAAQGDYAYITTQDGPEDHHVVVVDVSHPATPTVLARLEVAPWPSGIAVAHGYAYVVTGDGLQVVDVRSPALPRRVGFAGLAPHVDWSARGNVLVAGNYAYVVTLEQSDAVRVPARFVTVDIRDPRAPVEVARFDLGDTVGNYPILPGLALSGHYVCLAAQFGGLKIVDIAHPERARVVATVRASGYARDVRGVATMDDCVFAAGCTDGVLIFRLGPPPPATVTPPPSFSPSPPPASPTPTVRPPANLFLPRLDRGSEPLARLVRGGREIRPVAALDSL